MTEQIRLVGASGGIFWNLVGTMILLATAFAVCAPLAMGLALVERVWLRRPGASRALRTVLYTMNGVPSIVFGLFASYVIGVHGFEIPHAWYWPRMLEHTNMEDLTCGMLKGLVFGFIISLVSCHQGLKAENGAVGVGNGTTRAVVVASLAILIVNLFLSVLLNYFFPLGSSL